LLELERMGHIQQRQEIRKIVHRVHSYDPTTIVHAILQGRGQTTTKKSRTEPQGQRAPAQG